MLGERGGTHARFVLVLLMMGLVAGCGSNTELSSAHARPGAERTVAVPSGLPSASGSLQYDTSIAPTNETRSAPQIGSIVAAKGGQKAQQEALVKEAAEAAQTGAKPTDSAPAATSLPNSSTATSSPPEQGVASPVTSEMTTPVPQQTEAAPPKPPTPAPVAASVAAPPSEPVTPKLVTLSFMPQSANLNGAARTELDRVAGNTKDMRVIDLRAYASGNDSAEARKVALGRGLIIRSYLIDHGVRSRIEIGAFASDSDRVDVFGR